MWITRHTQDLTARTPLFAQVIDGLVAQGVPAHRIVVAGFSQGGATATLSSYTYPARCSLLPLLLSAVPLWRQLIFVTKLCRLAGCVNLSGWLPDRHNFASVLHPANRSTPMLWAHGNKDEIIAFSCQAAGAAVMRDAGVPVTSKDYDMGHDSSEAEFADVLQARRRVARVG